MCRLLRWKEIAQTRAAMTIREKFAGPKFLVSKYKDSRMVLFCKRLSVGQRSQATFAWPVSKPIIINITEPHNCIRRASSSITFKTWVRFPSAPPREYMFKVNYKSSSHASKRSVTFTKIFKTLEDVTVFLSSLEPLRFISCKKL